jgi:predicted ester cyclase
MPITNEQAVRSFYEALATGDTALIDEVCVPDWEGVPALRSGPGRDGWKKSIEHLRGVFSDLTISIEQLVEAGDIVAVRSVGRGVHTGTLLGVEGTGRKIEFVASDFHQLSDGMIVRTWHLEDYFGIAAQIGLEFSHAA